MKPQIAVGVLVIRNQQILLGKRHLSLLGGGHWSVPIGRLEFGESLFEGGLRELKEESGLTCQDIEVISIHNVALPDSHFVTFGLLAKGVEGTPIVNAPEEITQWAWFDLNTLPQPLLYPVYDMVDIYLQQGCSLNHYLREIIHK